MATTYEIIKGIQQAASNAYDGALDDKGEPVKVGLKREEGHPILDSRVMDGFSVKFHGDKLMVLYQSETSIKEVHGGKLEGEVESMVNDIVKFLRKEYKKITGDSLTLTKEGETDILVQKVSNVRVDVRANCSYKIGGLKDVESVGLGTPEDRLDKSIKSFLELGKGAPKPKNVTRRGS